MRIFAQVANGPLLRQRTTSTRFKWKVIDTFAVIFRCIDSLLIHKKLHQNKRFEGMMNGYPKSDWSAKKNPASTMAIGGGIYV